MYIKNIKELKKNLRARYRRYREKMNAEQKIRLDASIQCRLLTLEEYHQFLRQFPTGKRYYLYRGKGLSAYLSYQRANPSGPTLWRPRQDTLYCSVSGDNQEGFLFTEWCREGDEIS